jgi:hypothetical protein
MRLLNTVIREINSVSISRITKIRQAKYPPHKKSLLPLRKSTRSSQSMARPNLTLPTKNPQIKAKHQNSYET